MKRERGYQRTFMSPAAEAAAPVRGSASAAEGAAPVRGSASAAEGAAPVRGSVSAAEGAAPVRGSASAAEGAAPVRGSASAAEGAAPVRGSVSAAEGAAPVRGSASAAEGAAPVRGSASAAEGAAPVRESVSAAEGAAPVRESVSAAEGAAPVRGSVSAAEAAAPVRGTERPARQPIFRAAEAAPANAAPAVEPVRAQEIAPTAARGDASTGQGPEPVELPGSAQTAQGERGAAPVFGGVWPPVSGAEEGFPARREPEEPAFASDGAMETAAPAAEEIGFDPLSWQPVFGGGTPLFSGVQQTAAQGERTFPEPVGTPGVPRAAAPAPEAGAERRITAEEEYDAFREAFPDQGQLQVQVFTARQTYPVEGAEVVVSKRFPDGEFVISRSTTDGSGKGALVALPAQPSALSEHPGDAHPYTTYDVRVTHPNYAPVTIRDVTVFEGVRSLQKVDLVPVAALPDGMTEIEYTVGAPEL